MAEQRVASQDLGLPCAAMMSSRWSQDCSATHCTSSFNVRVSIGGPLGHKIAMRRYMRSLALVGTMFPYEGQLFTPRP
jgi:hypothetical protein